MGTPSLARRRSLRRLACRAKQVLFSLAGGLVGKWKQVSAPAMQIRAIRSCALGRIESTRGRGYRPSGRRLARVRAARRGGIQCELSVAGLGGTTPLVFMQGGGVPLVVQKVRLIWPDGDW